jgi:hypothetical protein
LRLLAMPGKCSVKCCEGRTTFFSVTNNYLTTLCMYAYTSFLLTRCIRIWEGISQYTLKLIKNIIWPLVSLILFYQLIWNQNMFRNTNLFIHILCDNCYSLNMHFSLINHWQHMFWNGMLVLLAIAGFLCNCVLYVVSWVLTSCFWLGMQNIEEDYGMFVWPCSIILAEYVWQQRSRFSGSKVVEVLTLWVTLNVGSKWWTWSICLWRKV